MVNYELLRSLVSDYIKTSFYQQPTDDVWNMKHFIICWILMNITTPISTHLPAYDNACTRTALFNTQYYVAWGRTAAAS